MVFHRPVPNLLRAAKILWIRSYLSVEKTRKPVENVVFTKKDLGRGKFF
jgi:hypothetical protein